MYNDPSHSNDLFLLGQIARRDESAFCELFDHRAPAILGMLGKVLDSAQAEEVLLEVFAEVWAGASGFHANGTSPFSWMLQLARGRAAERLRAALLRPPPSPYAPGIRQVSAPAAGR